MKYAIYIAAIVALAIGLFLYRRNTRRKVVKRFDSFGTLSFPNGTDDPLNDRIEFFISKRRKIDPPH